MSVYVEPQKTGGYWAALWLNDGTENWIKGSGREPYTFATRDEAEAFGKKALSLLRPPAFEVGQHVRVNGDGYLADRELVVQTVTLWNSYYSARPYYRLFAIDPNTFCSSEGSDEFFRAA